MSAIRTIALSALLTAGAVVSAPALALSISPANTTFTATGTVNLQGPGGIGGQCTVTFRGTVANGVATVNGAQTTFQGTGLICGIIRGVGNWPLVPTSGNTIQIQNVRVTAAGIVNCGPGPVNGNLVGGVFSFDATLPGNCRVASTSVPTLPALSVAP